MESIGCLWLLDRRRADVRCLLSLPLDLASAYRDVRTTIRWVFARASFYDVWNVACDRLPISPESVYGAG